MFLMRAKKKALTSNIQTPVHEPQRHNPSCGVKFGCPCKKIFIHSPNPWVAYICIGWPCVGDNTSI